jgi:hypothetical protein
MVADFNKDGYDDLVYRNVDDFPGTADGVHLRFGRPNGSGHDRPPQPTQTKALHAVAGDLNKDGHLDALVQSAGHWFNWYFGDGAGGFQFYAEISQTDFETIAPGDFNGDGWLDVAGTRWNASAVDVYTTKGLRGQSTFTGRFGTDAGPHHVPAGKFWDGSRPGDLDLITDNSDQTLTVLLTKTANPALDTLLDVQ